MLQRFDLFVRHHPLFRMDEALAWGLRRNWLRVLRARGVVRLAAPGLLADSDYWPDDRELAVAYYRDFTLCLESALWIHGLIDAEPAQHCFAHGRGSRKPGWDAVPAAFVVMSGASLTFGVTTGQLYGHPASVFSVEKTLADCLKFRARLGEQTVRAACSRALAEGRVDRHELEQAAQLCRVRTLAAPYLRAT